ncbi:hypothetical protein ACRRUL_003547 [Klebsiella pneumoniae]|nr:MULTISPECIES: hypothetical protein [Klebsiella]HBR1814062.1 hypothetical protein [Klebsiella quasipneumoniae subsp. similipneumoniae]EKJ7349147.1 hypothetical protein [Klebsiella pneumoniae]EKJ7749194.1 hypothetical protein [Klebsiella pneumoniae]EKV4518990.1 hypothetical protein [Klebsiella pneumoniae]EKW0310450.1 hypothetical protein [Klebsiella pneumoniae]
MEWLTLVATSAVVSAVVSGLLTLWNAHLQRKAEERKRLAELAMKMAIAEWESHAANIKDVGRGSLLPPEVYLYRYSRLLPLIEKGELTPEKLAELDADVRRIADTKPARRQQLSDAG